MSLTFPVKMNAAGAFKGHGSTLSYFEELIWLYHQGEDPCIFLPSLMQLSETLDCSTLEIQSALMGLRKQGYDYFMMDIYGPITLWCPPKLSSYPEEKPG